MTVDRAGDDPDQRPRVGRGEQRDLAGADVLVGGSFSLSSRGRFTQSWMPWKRPPFWTSHSGRGLDVEDAAPGGHPLGVAVGDRAAAAVGVLVVEDAVDDVGDGLEAAVRVPRRALGLARRVLHLAHLVHHDERVELRQVDAGERAAHREALPLVALRGGGDLPDRARLVAQAGLPQAVEDGEVVDGDRGHVAHLPGRMNGNG